MARPRACALACTFGVQFAVLGLSVALAERAAQNGDPELVRKCLLDSFHSGHLRERQVFSQVGEDGILEAVFACVGTTDKFYVEFGTADASQCSTRNLRENHGFSGLLMDGGHSIPEINLHQEFITRENIADLFKKHNVPKQFDHLTIDLDMNTFFIAQAVLAAGYRPRSLILEINRNMHALDQSYTSIYQPTAFWNTDDMNTGHLGTCYYGATPRALARMAQHFGYLPLVYDSSGVNIYLVHESVMGGANAPAVPSLDKLDADFNLDTALDALILAKACWDRDSCLRWPHHLACSEHVWLRVDATVDFSSPTWMLQLKPVILQHQRSPSHPDVRVFSETEIPGMRLVLVDKDGSTGTSATACPDVATAATAGAATLSAAWLQAPSYGFGGKSQRWLHFLSWGLPLSLLIVLMIVIPIRKMKRHRNKVAAGETPLVEEHP